MNEITSFRGTYIFLSNFYNCSFEYNGQIFYNSEQAYQYMKAETEEDKMEILRIKSPVLVKKFGHSMKINIKEFYKKKLNVMKDILLIKFSNNILKEKLKNTGNKIIIEKNYWHDNYWGSCICKKCENILKQNHLGKILMEIREMI